MENSILVDNKSIPLVSRHDKDSEGDRDDDYDDYITPNTTR